MTSTSASVVDQQWSYSGGSGSATDLSISTPAGPIPYLTQCGEQNDWIQACFKNRVFRAKYAALHSLLEDACGGRPLKSDPELFRGICSLLWAGKRCNTLPNFTGEPPRDQPSAQSLGLGSNGAPADNSSDLFDQYLWNTDSPNAQTQTQIQTQNRPSTPFDYASETGSQFPSIEQISGLSDANPGVLNNQNPNGNSHTGFPDQSSSTAGMAAYPSPDTDLFGVTRPLNPHPRLAPRPSDPASQPGISQNGAATADPSQRPRGGHSSKRRRSHLGDPKRNRNCDRVNYMDVRHLGACWTCWVGKKKCHPEHTGNRNFDHSMDRKALRHAGSSES